MNRKDFHIYKYLNFIKSGNNIFYGWKIVIATGFMLTLMSLNVFQGLGTLLVGLERNFGWSRTAMSGAFAMARVEGAVLGPIEGYLIDRLGSRKLILIGYLLMGIGFLVLATITKLWQFYMSFLIITLGSGLGGWLANISLINNWFNKKRNLAMACSLTGIQLGGFLVPCLALAMDIYGFRWTSIFTGIIFILCTLPVTKVIRNRPEDLGTNPDGINPDIALSDNGISGSISNNDNEFTVKQALKTPAFYLITTAHLTSSIAAVTLALHLVPKLTDIGFSLGNAGIVVLFYTALALPVQLLSGYLADRFRTANIIFIFLILQSIGIAIISIAETVPMVYLFALLYGIGFGGRIPLLTAIRGEYFGRKAFATIMGLSQLPNNLVMMGAPLFAGYMFDTRGDYTIPFLAFAIFGFLGAFLILFVKKPNIATTGS